MRNPRGFTEIIDPGASRLKTEFDAPTCIHCGMIMLVKPGFNTVPYVMISRRDGSFYDKEAGYCRRCGDYHCPKATCFVCDGPYLKKVEDDEAASRQRNRLII